MTDTKYPVVTLCGSTKFKAEFEQIQKELTLDGYIVISVGLFGHSGDDEVWEGGTEGTASRTKFMLDDMHKRKIEMADIIYVVNPGGYIGKSTESEICFAAMLGKAIDSLVEIPASWIEIIVHTHIQTAQERAWLNLQDYLYGSEGFASITDFPYLKYRRQKILDPWMHGDLEYGGDYLQGHTGEVMEPFETYGVFCQ